MTANISGVASVSPRARSLQFDAAEVDGDASRRGRFAGLLRHGPAGRARAPARPAGKTSSESPTAIRPETSVPVTTAPKPANGERAVDRQADDRRARAHVMSPARAPPVLRPVRRVPVRVRAETGDDRRAGEKAAGDQLAHLERSELQRLGIGEIGLRQRDEPALDAEQPADLEVLARLRLHALVGRHDQQHGVDAARAGQHVADEALVTGHVDEGELARRRPGTMREAEIDRDAARLFFLQPVGIDAGQRSHQRALAVIDVARGADDE